MLCLRKLQTRYLLISTLVLCHVSSNDVLTFQLSGTRAHRRTLARRWCTAPVATRAITGVALIVCIYNTPVFFELRTVARCYADATRRQPFRIQSVPEYDSISFR